MREPGSTAAGIGAAVGGPDWWYHGRMQPTTVQLEEPQLAELRRLAEERGVSIASLIREAVDEKLARAHQKPRSLGIAASGHADTARRTGEERPEPPPWR